MQTQGGAGRDGEDLRFAKVATAALATGDGGGWHIRPPCFVTISGMSAASSARRCKHVRPAVAAERLLVLS